ncbi:MAG TPA: hypothetical protein VNK23_01310 [Candidatus Dormibacteraeota bacterium]|nr:hypothetical protein [Candidatus Dormibacteraeota bacterium]
MSFAPEQQGASSAAKIFRIALFCIIAFGLASVLWRLAGSLQLPKNYELVADLAIGVVLMMTLNLARGVWRSADNSPSPIDPPNGPLG